MYVITKIGYISSGMLHYANEFSVGQYSSSLLGMDLTMLCLLLY